MVMTAIQLSGGNSCTASEPCPLSSPLDSTLVAAVRTPAKAEDLAARGVNVRLCDYDRAETLLPAFEGIERLVMISASEPGRRGCGWQSRQPSH